MDEKKKCKPYVQDEEPTVPNMVNEPAVAYGVDEDIIKKRIVLGIDKLNDAKKLRELEDKLDALLYSMSNRPPCQYTIDELRERLNKAEEDKLLGRYYTWEEIREKHKSWLK